MGASQAGWWARLAGLEAAVTARLDQMANDGLVERIWSGEPAVWSGSADTPELTDRLGWCVTTPWPSAPIVPFYRGVY